MVKKSHITLLEVMIILAILSLAGGAIAFNIRKFYGQQQVLDDISKVTTILNTASEMMMLVDLDSEVRFSEEDGKLKIALVPQSGVSHNVLPLLKDQPITLSHLDKVFFRDGVQQTMLTPPFSLTFESKGFLMNRGILQLQGKGIERYFVFLGYPAKFSPLSGNEEYQDGGMRDRVEKITEQVKNLTMPPEKVL